MLLKLFIHYISQLFPTTLHHGLTWQGWLPWWTRSSWFPSRYIWWTHFLSPYLSSALAGRGPVLAGCLGRSYLPFYSPDQVGCSLEMTHLAFESRRKIWWRGRMCLAGLVSWNEYSLLLASKKAWNDDSVKIIGLFFLALIRKQKLGTDALAFRFEFKRNFARFIGED